MATINATTTGDPSKRYEEGGSCWAGSSQGTQQPMWSSDGVTTDSINTNGQTLTLAYRALNCGGFSNTSSSGKLILQQNLEASLIQDTPIEVGANTVTISTGKIEGATGISGNGIRLTKGQQSAVTLTSSSANVTILGDIAVTSSTGGHSGIKWNAAGKVALLVGDIYMNQGTSSGGNGGLYGCPGATLDHWQGSMYLPGATYGAYGVYTLGLTIFYWYGNVVLGTSSAHYGVYVGSSSTINNWNGNIQMQAGTGLYLMGGIVNNWSGDVYMTGSSSSQTGVYVSSGTLGYWYGDVNILGTYSSTMYGVELTGGNITNWYGDVTYAGSSSSVYLLMAMGGILSNWYGNLFNNGTANCNVLYLSGATITAWYGNVNSSAGTALYLSNGTISSWYGDLCIFSGTGIIRSSGTIGNWYYYQDNNGYTGSNTGGTVTKRSLAQRISDMTASGQTNRKRDLPFWPNTIGGIVGQSSVLLNQARWPGDLSLGTYVTPIQAGYSALAPSYGTGTVGSLAASKIRDATYGTLADANVLVAAGGTFNEAARNVDPGVANVRRPADGGPANYKIAGAALIGTLNIAADNPPADSVLESAGGTYHAPAAAEVIPTAVFGPNSSIVGTFPIPDHLLRLK